MPSKDSHLDQAKSNIRFLSLFYNGENFNDWAVTVAFYSCLHVVEFGIDSLESIPQEARIRKDTENHHKRIFRLVENYFKEIEDDYKHLYKQSRSSRYYFYKPHKLAAELLIKVQMRNILNWSNLKFGTDLKYEVEKSAVKR